MSNFISQARFATTCLGIMAITVGTVAGERCGSRRPEDMATRQEEARRMTEMKSRLATNGRGEQTR